jgi:threonine dehydrogenase-like Zn-dependent dehydrogenase
MIVTVTLRLESAMPGKATQTLAGKIVAGSRPWRSAGSAGRQSARRDPLGPADDDLLLGSAPARRLHPDDAEGDVIGHEYMGEVVEAGRETSRVKPGDRVVVPSFLGGGKCWYCEHDEWSLCNTHPKPELAESVLGYPTGGIPGYCHAFGGYVGPHAEYIRVPHADVNCFHVPEGSPTNRRCSFPTRRRPGTWAPTSARSRPGDTVAVWGCGGVGLIAQRSALLMGAEWVIAIDRFAERLTLARDKVVSETIDYSATDSVLDELRERTGGRGPDACIEALGALREAPMAVRKAWTLAIVGVYGVIDSSRSAC